MKRWRIAILGPTEIFLHPAVFLYLLYAWCSGYLPFTLCAFLSIALHEAGHSAISAICGQAPGSIELTPLGAVMHLEDESKLSRLRRLIVLLAGPAVTLLLCWSALLFTRQGSLPWNLGRMLFLCNLSILAMNLLPVLPLDGGRLLALLLESFLPQHIAGKVMRGISVTIGAGLILLNIAISFHQGGWNLSLAFAGCCILYSAAQYASTHAMRELHAFMERKIMLERKGSLPVEWRAVQHSMPVCKLIRSLPPRNMVMFLCVEIGSQRLLGCVDEYALIQHYLSSPEATLQDTLSRADGWKKFAKSGTF